MSSRRGQTSDRLFSFLNAPVDNASITFFRIAIGLVLVWHVWEHFATGKIATDFATPGFHYTWDGFEWVKPLPVGGMKVVFIVMGVAAVGITIGFQYRLSALVCCGLFTYQFLIDKAYYLNHYYLTCLLTLLLVFIPAHRSLSLDALTHPSIRSNVAPRWALWLIRFQIAIPYVYGGIAKFDPDWIRGRPAALFLLRRQDHLGFLAPYASDQWFVWLIAYGGLVFDLLIVPLLLWRRTRVPAFMLACVFHTTNSIVFDIGYFPWFMLLATTIYFEPDWPRRLIRSLVRFSGLQRGAPKQDHTPVAQLPLGVPSRRQQWGAVLLGLYVAIQLLVPFRHHFHPGRAVWSEEGNQFCWHMILSHKECLITCYVTDKMTRRTELLDIRQFLNNRQLIRIGTYPRMLQQFAHYLRERIKASEHRDVEVRFLDLISFNGRKPQPLVEPMVDLAAEPFLRKHPPWIVALREPYRKELYTLPKSRWKDDFDITPYRKRRPERSTETRTQN